MIDIYLFFSAILLVLLRCVGWSSAECLFCPAGFKTKYEFDFPGMTQRNTESGTTKPIRRVVPAADPAPAAAATSASGKESSPPQEMRQSHLHGHLRLVATAGNVVDLTPSRMLWFVGHFFCVTAPCPDLFRTVAIFLTLQPSRLFVLGCHLRQGTPKTTSGAGKTAPVSSRPSTTRTTSSWRRPTRRTRCFFFVGHMVPPSNSCLLVKSPSVMFFKQG